MKTIQLNRDFAFNFYPDSTLMPDIRHITEGFYGVDDEVSISYEDAKQMIAALQSFVQAVDAAVKKQEANDQIAMSMGYLWALLFLFQISILDSELRKEIKWILLSPQSPRKKELVTQYALGK